MILVHQTFVPQSLKLYDERYSESSIPDLVTEVVKLPPGLRLRTVLVKNTQDWEAVVLERQIKRRTDVAFSDPAVHRCIKLVLFGPYWW